MRLTEKLTKENKYLKYIYKDTSDKTDFGILNKLGQLEDIEEELGIDLITFYKIYAYGFYYKYKDEILYGLGYDNEINVASHKITTRYTTLHFKDYGKTWALTKEELED